MTPSNLVRTMAFAALLLPAAAGAQATQAPPPQYTPPPQYQPAPPPQYQPAPPPQYQPAPPSPYKPWKPHYELVGMAGYHVSSDLNFYGYGTYGTGHATIDGSASYGAALRATVSPGQTVEVLWVIVPTNLHFYTGGLSAGTTSLTINYFQIGGVQQFRSDRLEPYFGGTLGAAVFAPGSINLTNVSGQANLNASDVWRFAFTLAGGLKVWLTENLALQAEARMMVPVWFSSSAFYVGPGGAAFGVSGGIPIVEGNFTGGLVLAI